MFITIFINFHSFEPDLTSDADRSSEQRSEGSGAQDIECLAQVIIAPFRHQGPSCCTYTILQLCTIV